VNMNGDFEHKVALVTGAARGIGKCVASTLLGRGAKVALIDCNESLLAEFDEASNENVIRLCGDVTDKEFVQSSIKEVLAKFGHIDILVNNAGITRDGFLTNITEKDWDDVIDVNLKGAFLFAQAVYPSMSEKNYGKIVNIISASWLGNIGQANYSASKGGLVGMTRTLAMEAARYSINVNGVSPGLVDTEMSRAVPDKIKEKLINSRPLKRMGTTADIAEAVCFLASDKSSYITGQILHVDGGKSCGQLAL
jgi:3-oxoacyl-[acyl-carrier protein] reductase